MALHMLGKDPDSPNNGSPTLYYDTQDDTYVIQGWRISDMEVLTQLDVPAHETVIRFPRRMMRFFFEVNGEVSSGGGIGGT